MPRRLASVPEAQSRDGAYVRVSAVMGRAGEDFLSPSIQIDTITAASARTGGRIDPAHVWEDIDVSGRSMARPRLTEALQAARDGVIDRLWVYDLSRFARNAAEGLTELVAIEKTGVEVVSATESIDRSTSAGRLTAGLLMLLAEMKSDQIGEGWQRVITANAERGIWHGRPPQGYVRTGKREITPHPIEGALWAEAFVRYASGHGLRQVAVWLSAALGRTVQPNEVSRTLRSPAYLGLVKIKDRTWPGRHQPLVDEPTWAKVQDRLAANARVPSRTKGTAHALAGLLRCDRCGGAVHKRSRAGRGQPPGVFCQTAVVHPDRCQGLGMPPLPPIVDGVRNLLRDKVVDYRDTSAETAAVRAAQRARAASDARTLQDEIAKTEKAIGAAAVKNATGVLSDTAYRLATEQLEVTLARLVAQQTEQAAVEDVPDLREAANLAEALLELWPSMTDAERNRALRTHVRAVHVLPATSRGSRRPRRVRVTWTDGTTTSTPRTASPQPKDEGTGRFLPRG